MPINFDNINNENEIITPEVVEMDNYSNTHYLKSIGIYFLTIYGFTFFVQIALVFIYSFIFKLNATIIDDAGNAVYTEHAKNFLNLWTQIVTYASLLVIVIVLLHKDLVKDFFKTFSSISSAFSVLKKVVIGIVLLYGASIAANAILIALNITRASANQSDIETMIANCSSTELVLFGIILVVVTPLIEELIFRKSLFGYLKKYNFSGSKMIIVSALIFGGIHIFTSIISLIVTAAPLTEILTELILIIPYFAMGAALSYSYEKSDRNIIVPYLVHLVNNLISLLLILFFPSI